MVCCVVCVGVWHVCLRVRCVGWEESLEWGSHLLSSQSSRPYLASGSISGLWWSSRPTTLSGLTTEQGSVGWDMCLCDLGGLDLHSRNKGIMGSSHSAGLYPPLPWAFQNPGGAELFLCLTTAKQCGCPSPLAAVLNPCLEAMRVGNASPRVEPPPDFLPRAVWGDKSCTSAGGH